MAASYRNRAITNRVNAPRRAIGDSGERQRLIRTVSRKGFRFIGAIKKEAVEWTKEAVPQGSHHRHGLFAAFAATLPMTEKPKPQAEDAQT
jgi:DNA-binding winged helix-turn-helix (wHTH) protein